MTLTKPKLWIVGTAAICAVIVLAGWFLLIAPKRAEASELRTQTASIVAANDQLEVRIAQLKADFAELPQRKAELAAIKRALPQDVQLAALTRDVSSVASGSGVTLMSISPGTLTPVVAPLPAAPAVGTESTDGAGADTAPAPVPAGPSVSELIVSVTVIGDFEAAEAFLEGLQEDIDRRYLVDGLTATAETAAAASGAKPAVANGDVTFTVTGRVFVLAPPTAAATAGAAGATN